MKCSDGLILQTHTRLVNKWQRGMSLLEVVLALGVMAIAMSACLSFIVSIDKAVAVNQDYSFAIQKAVTIVSELRAYAESHESTGGASVLDIFDDGVGTSPLLTIDSSIGAPDHILSGNRWITGRWYYARRISVRKFPSFEASNVRIVTVKIFQTHIGKNDETLMADITSVITTAGDSDPTTQVYDAYLLGIENIPGWWVYLAYLTPFIENALGDMESRNPGMKFRRHWVTKAAYGRDQEYNPYFNNAADSNQTINYAYFYPGTMPAGSAVSQYYVPTNVNARVNIDGVATNDYSATANPYPYALADQFNHAMRYPAELALFNSRLAAGQETTGNLTYRLLLDDMVLNPAHYRNALFINLHGELLPMPSIRNYSDAAKDPATYPQWRAVTHPEKLRYALTDDLKLRVYGYLADPSVGGNNFMTVPVSITIPGMNLTTSSTDIQIASIEGGTDQRTPAGADTYTVISPALTAASENRMWYTKSYDAVISSTVILLYNTPLRTPRTPDFCGLDTVRRLYGLDYIPCPVEAANDFSQNLVSTVNSWDVMVSASSNIDTGGALCYPGTGDYIYAFRGGSSQTFMRYSISGNSWTGKSNYGSNVGAGGALAYVPSNGRIYGFRGNSQTNFRSYVEDSWTARTAAPAAVAAGGALCYPGTGDIIYAFQGGTTTFWRYKISTDSWTTPGAATVAPAAVGTGAALVATGGDYIYAFRGGTQTTFWRYSISGNSWTARTVAPATVGAGGALVYPGSGDYIYAFRGGTQTTFWRYSISGDSWTVMTAVPDTIAAGGALVATSEYIYAFRGNAQATFWRGSSLPKNTVRWVITIPKAVVDREKGVGDSLITINTRIGTDLNTGTRWPANNKPADLSTTYVWRTNSINNVPFSERYQFQGDPRHCPYSDVYSYDGYNWYFDNLCDATKNAQSEWPNIDTTRINGGGDTTDGWHGGGGTGGDRMEIDVPRFFQFIRTALTGSNAVYTSITGWSYYYMGLGNEIGYDSANGFTNSIPTHRKPFDGGATGSRNEDSITDAQTGGVKYIRESISPYTWWSKPWLGEIYPDSACTTWTATGNIFCGTGAGYYVRIRRQDIRTSGSAPLVTASTLPAGTTFDGLTCVRRTNAYGCTSFFNIGTTTSTFRHEGRDGTTGNVTLAGQAMANGYNLPLPGQAAISRPFRHNNDWGNTPNEFSIADYSGIRCTAAVNTDFYGHQDGAAWKGSTLLQLADPAGSNAFIVVNGLDRTVENGSAFIGRYAVVSLVNSFLTGGIPATASRIVQLPRCEIKTPNVTTELENPTTISITWLSEWKRWDGQTYTTAYPVGFTETENDLRYALLYSRDNGKNWLHIVDNTPATPGIPDKTLWIADAATGGNESYLWDVSNAGYYSEGSYIMMLEAYRFSQDLHYAYHRQKIYINR
ncbi:MAG: prepilin-type N-terminal cleavage/methylation domain-containing protein [Planctomycetota bacterium]